MRSIDRSQHPPRDLIQTAPVRHRTHVRQTQRHAAEVRERPHVAVEKRHLVAAVVQLQERTARVGQVLQELPHPRQDRAAGVKAEGGSLSARWVAQFPNDASGDGAKEEETVKRRLEECRWCFSGAASALHRGGERPGGVEVTDRVQDRGVLRWK